MTPMNPRYIVCCASVLVLADALAQEQLSKEITIEREIVPEVRAASRLNVYPRALSFKPQVKSLLISDFTEAAQSDPTISLYEPANTSPAAMPTPWRGYLDAGYFPAANVGVSAGYSIIGNNVTRLNIWGQLDNRNYKSAPLSEGTKETFRHLIGRIGVDFAHVFGEAGKLDVATDFGFSSFNQPWSVIEKSLNDGDGKIEGQSVAEWNLSAMWKGSANHKLNYHAGASFGIFNFSKGLEMESLNATAPGTAALPETITLPAVHQTSFGIDMGVVQQINAASSAGVDLTGDLLSYNHFAAGSGKAFGVGTLKPYYRFGNDVVTLKAGVRLDLTMNCGKAVHVAPDVLFGVNPASGFGGWLRLGGGEHLNSLQSLQAFSPYISQLYAYGVSHMPVTGDLGLRFGPVHGASLTLKLAYASANDWLLPVIADNQLLFSGCNLRSWKAGAQLNWKFREIVVLEASFESTLGNGEKDTWIEWRDRARHVLGASATVTPISPFSVTLSYQMRMKRSMPVWDGVIADVPAEVGLEDVNNLGIGAAWKFTDALSVFARVDNVLDSESYLLPLVPAQGLNGLVGVAWKF